MVLRALLDAWGDGKLRRGRPKGGIIVLDQRSRDLLRRLAVVGDPCEESQKHWSDEAIKHFSTDMKMFKYLIASGWIILMPDEQLNHWVLKRTTVGTKAVINTFF